MDSGTKVISQKEYLKKYLSKPNPEKKKKKSEKISSSTFLKRSVIVDDDVPLREIPVPEEEIINLDYLGDEAPQIAGFVDERPLDMIWKPIDQKEEDKEEVVNIFERTKQSKSKKKVKDDLPLSESNFQGETKHSNKKDEKSKRRSHDSDFSPERRKPKVDSDGDLSPPRKSRKNGRHESGTSKNYDSDLSPPRSRKENYEKSKHYSKKRYDSDYSHHKRSERREPSPKRRRKGSDSDNSPPRKSDKSRERKNYDSDSSPPRKYSKDSRHESTHRRHDKYSSESKHKSKYDKNHSRGDYLEKTLDGKKSGLQSAKNLKDELRELKDKEDRAFKEMDPTVLGQSASTIVRDRKTGLKRDFAKEKEAIKERNAKEAARKEKYDKWGRGLKQVQEQEGKVADALHEMSKPLARYKDDEDLDKYLRERQRDGDPMLEYIRKQQAEAHTVIDLTEPESGRKRYQGNYNANRFGIPPGYRWDGVDRSNGYEIKWFEHKNARKAGEEEVYKWSVADM